MEKQESSIKRKITHLLGGTAFVSFVIMMILSIMDFVTYAVPMAICMVVFAV